MSSVSNSKVTTSPTGLATTKPKIASHPTCEGDACPILKPKKLGKVLPAPPLLEQAVPVAAEAFLADIPKVKVVVAPVVAEAFLADIPKVKTKSPKRTLAAATTSTPTLSEAAVQRGEVSRDELYPSLIPSLSLTVNREVAATRKPAATKPTKQSAAALIEQAREQQRIQALARIAELEQERQELIFHLQDDFEDQREEEESEEEALPELPGDEFDQAEDEELFLGITCWSFCTAPHEFQAPFFSGVQGKKNRPPLAVKFVPYGLDVDELIHAKLLTKNDVHAYVREDGANIYFTMA